MVQHGEPLIEELHGILNLDTLLAFLHHDSISTRIMLLQVLDLYLHTPSLNIAAKLAKSNECATIR